MEERAKRFRTALDYLKQNGIIRTQQELADKTGTKSVSVFLRLWSAHWDCFSASFLANRRARRRRFTALVLPSPSVKSARRCKYLTASSRWLLEITTIGYRR